MNTVYLLAAIALFGLAANCIAPAFRNRYERQQWAKNFKRSKR